MNNEKRKKLVVLFDVLSLTCGCLGIILGLLSLFALVQGWFVPLPDDKKWHDLMPSGTQTYEDKAALISMVITIVCLFFDGSSGFFAMLSFIFGRKIFKEIQKIVETDPVKKVLNTHEKRSYRFDEVSFALCVVGFLFGLASLLTIVPWKNDIVSMIVTGIAVILDVISAIMIIFALSELAKYNETKNTAQLLRERINSGRTRRW